MTEVFEVPPQQSTTDDEPADGSGSDDEDGKKGEKSRRELPPGAVATLKAWLLSPEHFTHPYPTPQDQAVLMQQTGIDKKQLKNWFTNARRRIWKPLLRKQLEQGKLTAAGSGSVAVVNVSGSVSGLMNASQVVPAPGNYSTPMGGTAIADPIGSHAIHYAQTLLANFQQNQNVDVSMQPIYNQQATQQTQTNYLGAQMTAQVGQCSSSSYYPQTYGQQTKLSSPMANSNSIGSLSPMHLGSTPSGSTSNFNKTDSHAILMELFARDQDLVRQATEGQKIRAAAQLVGGAGESSQMTNGGSSGGDSSHMNGGDDIHQSGSQQHPMKLGGSGNKTESVGFLNSWPHFSSVSSLNNLGTMTGVKSVNSMSGADLGRADSFSFLEVFFDNSTSASGVRGMKREREEDNDVGLSLDADESSSNSATKLNDNNSGANMCSSVAPVPAPLPEDGKDKDGLERACDEARAAHGLISVSRSSEKLPDLVLPAKMQRTLSQNFLKSMHSGGSDSFGSFGYSIGSLPSSGSIHPPSSPTKYQQSQQYPGQIPQKLYHGSTIGNCTAPLSDPSSTGASVEVPISTKCSLCQCINVDTQLRPCGHMFHGRCLKPSLQNAIGPPKCPIDHTPMQSAVLAVPTDEKVISNNPNAFQPHHLHSQSVKLEVPNGNA